MSMTKAYEELVDFIAAGIKPDDVIAYKPSDWAQERVTDLIQKEKTNSLSSEEKSELDHYLQLEHLMRLAKARAHQYITHE